MSPTREKQLEHECMMLRGELQAMEQLVQRYQEELRALLRANDLIQELECRDKVYRSHMLKLQQAVEQLSNDLYTRSFDLQGPVAVPLAVSQSAEVLHQTEALLDDMLREQGLTRLDSLAVTSEVQRRRSEMVAACEHELKTTMDEFHDLTRTLERRRSLPPSA
ncbi:Chromosome transmission fidelity protein 18 [Phytophthora boehmeriae]|uniref:Chromosome transmission fidelity protein 18 n=1 Tax=Phytophthora boehmeriae TaxID=109152 RepID=A0A8T1X076_9STRA|nr:Chromosome transmission fidelity protein 18 [Phytophthora boehmeriae]